MHFKTCLLCGFATFCVIFAAPPTTLFTSLKKLTHEKCPSYESLASKSLFLTQCIASPTLVFDKDGLDNGKIMLCSLYYSVFQHFCASTNSTFYDISNLTKEFAQIPQEFSTKPTDVCNSLKLINSTILKPDLVKVFNKSSSCMHLCTDVFGEVIDICSLTSFIWNLTEDYRVKGRTVQPQGEIVPILSGNARNDASKSLNSGVNSSVNGEQQSISNDSLVIQTSTVVVAPVLPKEVTTQSNKEVSKPKNNKSTPQHNEQVQMGEIKPVTDQKQSFTKATSNEADNKPEAIDEKNTSKVANNNGKKTKTNEINAKHVTEIKLNVTDLEEKSSRGTQVTENGKTEGINNKPIVSQPAAPKGGKEQSDNPDDNKSDDLTMYMDKDDGDDDENELSPPKKTTKVNKGKPEDDGYELPPQSSEVKTKLEVAKPKEIDEDIAVNYKNQNIDDSDSYFFSYFMMVCVVFICGYVAYHNKQKILALVLEGRKGRRSSRTRRPNSSNYRKLDSTLEEAVTSSCNKNSTQVIY